MENGIIRKFATSNPTFNRFELVSNVCLRGEFRQPPSAGGRMRGPHLLAFKGARPRGFERGMFVLTLFSRPRTHLRRITCSLTTRVELF